jgi:hypothetical protein
MEVRIGAVDLDRFVPGDRLQAELRLPVKLHEGRFILGIDQRKVWTPNPSMKRKRARDGTIRHDPHDHVHTFWGQADEVPEIVMGGLPPAERHCPVPASRNEHDRGI